MSVKRWLCARIQCYAVVRAGQVLTDDGRDGYVLTGDGRDG